MKDLALFASRVAMGGLLAGHGAQKLFGSFGGHGLHGTAGWLESIGFRPGRRWAVAASASEFGGGVLTTLGLGGPLGPIATMGAMAIATGTVHWGKPIWAASGGAELPVTNIATAAVLAATGPGRYSLDRLLGIRVPGWLATVALFGTAAGVAYALFSREVQPVQQEHPEQVAQRSDQEAEEDERERLARQREDARAAFEQRPAAA